MATKKDCKKERETILKLKVFLHSGIDLYPTYMCCVSRILLVYCHVFVL